MQPWAKWRETKQAVARGCEWVSCMHGAEGRCGMERRGPSRRRTAKHRNLPVAAMAPDQALFDVLTSGAWPKVGKAEPGGRAAKARGRCLHASCAVAIGSM